MQALILESPERLWWSFVLLVPLLIHLLRRRRYHQHGWAAMEFVVRAMQEKSQKARLQRLVLMIVRVFILALFLLAVSSPQSGVSKFDVDNISSGTHYVFILDASYSMGTIDQVSGDSAFEIAKQEAFELLHRLPPGDVVSVLTIGDFERWVIESPANDFQEVVVAIDEIELQVGGGNVKTVLESTADLILESRQAHPDLLHSHVMVFTDLEQNVWTGLVGEESEDGSPLKRLKELGQVSVVGCQVDPRSNLALKSLTCSYPQGAFAKDVVVMAEVECYYQEEAASPGISWYVDNQFIRRDELEIQQGQLSTISLPLNNLDSGSHQVEARLDDDSLAIDNSRWIVFDSPAKFRVLCVEGSPGESVALETALHPTEDPEWPVSVVTINESQVEQQELTEYEMVAFCGANAFTRQTRRLLREFVSQGGILLVTPGKNLDTKSLNELYALVVEEFDFGIRWGNLIRQDESVPLKVRVANHRIGEIFRSNPGSGVNEIPVFEYVELELKPDENSGAVLELENGSPLFAFSSVGDGVLLTFSTSLLLSQSEERWSDLGAWPSFLPLIHESLKYVLESQTKNGHATLGTTPERRVSMKYGPLEVEVKNPAGVVRPYLLDSQNDLYSGQRYIYWLQQDFKIPGVYYVSYSAQGKVVENTMFVGNLRVTESDHRLIDQSTLELLTNEQYTDASTGSLHSKPRHRNWFTVILLLTLTLMLFELKMNSRQSVGSLGRTGVSND